MDNIVCCFCIYFWFGRNHTQKFIQNWFENRTIFPRIRKLEHDFLKIFIITSITFIEEQSLNLFFRMAHIFLVFMIAMKYRCFFDYLFQNNFNYLNFSIFSSFQLIDNGLEKKIGVKLSFLTFKSLNPILIVFYDINIVSVIISSQIFSKNSPNVFIFHFK